MKKILVGRFAFALAASALIAFAPEAHAIVQVAGLAQAKFSNGNNVNCDTNSVIRTADTLTFVAGTIMGDTKSPAKAKDYADKEWSWADNTTYAYEGEMWMEAGKTYTFGEQIDDVTFLAINGVQYIYDTVWNAFSWTNYTPSQTGWVPIEVRFGNASGGAGVTQDAKFGFAYNTEDKEDWKSFKDADGWMQVRDPGDSSLLRTLYSENDFMLLSGIEKDGEDLKVTLSFSNIPDGGAKAILYYGASDGGTSDSSWESSKEIVSSVLAGDTASSTFTVSGGAEATFAAMKLVSTGSIPYYQWTDSHNLNLPDPTFALMFENVGYTNLTLTAAVIGLGSGASSVTAKVELSTDSEFSTIAFTKELSLAGTGSESVDITGLETNTLYYARVNGTNDLEEEGMSATVSATTLLPTPVTGTVSFRSTGFTTISAATTVTSYGDASSWVHICLEASTDETFATLNAVTEDVSPELNTETVLTLKNLVPETNYHLRFRYENEWGFVAYLPLSGTLTTRKVPLSTSGIGYKFSADGSTIDFTFAVTEVFDGATLSASLSYDGKTVGSAQTITGAGTLSWLGVTAAKGEKSVIVTVTSTVGDSTYSQTWTITATPGTNAYVISSLAEIGDLVFRIGDKATLPKPAIPGDYYVVMDMRSFSLDEDGVILTALEPGFSAVCSMEWDVTAGEFVRNTSTAVLAVCIPEVEGNGRVFLATATGNMDWNGDSSKWRNLTNDDNDYPHRVDDVAIIPTSGQVTIKTDVTVGEIYFGPTVDKLHGEIRLGGNDSATLTFERSSGKPGLLRCTGQARCDIVTSGRTYYKIGGVGNQTNGLAFEMPDGLEIDGGCWRDYTDLTMRDIFGKSRHAFDECRYWKIPEGKTLRIVNTYGIKVEGDDQGGCANVNWNNSAQIIGSGTFLYDGASSTYIDNPFYQFEGTVYVRNKQLYDNFAMDKRGGSFFMVNWTQKTQIATNATLLVEGHGGTNAKSSMGVVSYGNSHGFGAWGWTDNAFPAKKWIFNGGSLYQSAMCNSDVTWRADGTENTEPVCVPNGADTLVISNGFNVISLGQNSTVTTPTNSLVFAHLEHAGDGTLYAPNERMSKSDSNSKAGSNFRVRTVLGGFHEHAIGGNGIAEAVHGGSPSNRLDADAPIVPWIVATTANALYFPGATSEGELVLAGLPEAKELNNFVNSAENARVYDTSIALDHDVTVNSLVIDKNSSKEKKLGQGRTLTITSGGLVLTSSNNSEAIGEESGVAGGANGALVFPRKAYIYSQRSSDFNNQIWATVTAPYGAVFSYPGKLVLGGDQTGIHDHISINGADIQLGTANTPGVIDVPVHLYGGNSCLRVMSEDSFNRKEQIIYFWDHGTPGSKLMPPAGLQVTVRKAYIDGVSIRRGIWGSSESEAPNVDDNHFSGTGTVRIVSDDSANPLIIMFR